MKSSTSFRSIITSPTDPIRPHDFNQVGPFGGRVAGCRAKAAGVQRPVNDDRLVFSVIDLQSGLGEQRGGGLFAIDREGGDFRELAPKAFADSGLFPVKLQMMRSQPFGDRFQVGTHLAAGVVYGRMCEHADDESHSEPPGPQAADAACEVAWRQLWSTFWREAEPRFSHVLTWAIPAAARRMIPGGYHRVFSAGELEIYARGAPPVDPSRYSVPGALDRSRGLR